MQLCNVILILYSLFCVFQEIEDSCPASLLAQIQAYKDNYFNVQLLVSISLMRIAELLEKQAMCMLQLIYLTYWHV